LEKTIDLAGGRIMSFPKYDRYKESGVEWLGEVPEHWNVGYIKRLTKRITDGAHISPETENGVYAFISTKDVKDNSLDFDNCLRTSVENYEYLVRNGCKPMAGDVLFSKDGTIGRTIVVKEEQDFVVASSLIIISPDQSILSPVFLNYLCQSSMTVSQVECLVKGAGLPRLSIQNLLRIVGAFPSLNEQRSISTFLDRETAKIDELITEQQRLIDLLKEKRQAVISHAVTKGLNPDVPMKKTAIEWLGEVPEHWKLEQLKSFTTFSGGGTPSRENLKYWNGNIPWVSPKDMKTECIHGAEEFITEEGLNASSATLQHPGQVLMVVRSGILKHTIPVAINQVSVALNQDMKALNFSGNCSSHFFLRWAQGLNNLLLLVWAKQGATVESIEQSYLAKTIVPLPPYEEQQLIITFLDRAITEFDELIAEAQHAIALLQERRTAIISAAVTGKIDVRSLISEPAQ
jgi:type I restriction enzyme, S subunit